jgi:hypothetical protein
MKKFEERIHQYNMRTLLQVPAIYRDIVGKDAWDVQWDASNPYCKVVDLTLHWGKLPLDHILKWQRDFNGYSSNADQVSSIWIKDLLASSMDTELKRQVDEQYRELDLYQQGCISYFKIVLDTVFKMSSMTEESLKSFIKDFGKNGLAKVPNENVYSKLMVLPNILLIQVSCTSSPLHSMWKGLLIALCQSSRWFL